MVNVDRSDSSDLVDRLKANDEAAWVLLVERYTEPLLHLVRRALPRAIRVRVDEEDVVQEVFRSVFVRVHRGQFACDSDDGLWRILCVRAIKRIRGEVRKHMALRRDVRREESRFSTLPDYEQYSGEPTDPHAGPEELASTHDEFWGLVNSLDPRSQVIVYLRLDGYTIEELAELMGCSLRTVQSLWEGVCKKARLPLSVTANQIAR